MASKHTPPKQPKSPSPFKNVSFKTGVILVALGVCLGAIVMFALRPRDSVSQLVTERMLERNAARERVRAETPAARPSPRPAPAPVPVPAHATATPTPVPAPSAPPRARMAIVLDDWGYNLDAHAFLKQVDAPLTLAILPGLPYSARIAEDGHKEGHEVILHMPMEPKAAAPAEKSTILAAMPDAEIRTRLNQAIDAMPHLVGVSNHQGSKATADARVMKTVLTTLKDRRLFFLDSLTTGDSTAGAEGKTLGMTVLRRDVFLDNERTEAAIQTKLDELARLAKSQGYAIGIGHDEEVTLAVIQKNIERYKAEGIDVVPLSDLYKKKS